MKHSLSLKSLIRFKLFKLDEDKKPIIKKRPDGTYITRQRHCKNCHKKYKPKRNHQKFCSEKCSKQKRREEKLLENLSTFNGDT